MLNPPNGVQLKLRIHIPTVVIPGSDHNPPSNQGGIHENQA